ncbi:MAG: hypothetical protein GY842_03805 [bacterium]|nr:hypothetical protein [bacterium]
MKLVIDMNLTPDWVGVIAQIGFEAVHWAQVGDPKAPDEEILEWASRNDRVIFTNDLDFSRLVALTRATGPSILQIRGRRLLPEDSGELVARALSKCQEELEAGALVVIDENTWRARILPI